METISNNLPEENGKNLAYKYYCDSCDYKCYRKYHWERHLTTTKHINSTNSNNLATKMPQKGQQYECEHCSKQYSDRSGLWRHKKKCIQKEETIPLINTTNTIYTSALDLALNTIDEQKELIQYLMKEKSEFKQITEINKQIIQFMEEYYKNQNI